MMFTRKFYLMKMKEVKKIFLSFYKGDITKTLSAIEEMMADPAN